MRTTDFSLAPAHGQAEGMLLVDSALATRRWLRDLQARASQEPSHRWHQTYCVAGHRGILIGFANRESLEAFRASVTDAQTRAYTAETNGYSNGVWRAEGSRMAHIARFTPVTREVERGSTPPEVAGGGPPGHKRHGKPARSASHAARSPMDGDALFVGATKYNGPHSWLVLARTWYPMLSKMRRLSGYVWHTVYWPGSFTLGTIAFFETRDDLLVFARTPEHRHLMQWIVGGTQWATGGYIRILIAEDEGRS